MSQSPEQQIASLHKRLNKETEKLSKADNQLFQDMQSLAQACLKDNLELKEQLRYLEAYLEIEFITTTKEINGYKSTEKGYRKQVSRALPNFGLGGVTSFPGTTPGYSIADLALAADKLNKSGKKK